MDVLEEHSIPAFSRLPAEIHILIVEEILQESSDYWRYINEFPILKNLRLTCRQYAYLPRLLSSLFHGVRLLASPHHVELANTMDMSKINPYVKRVVFEPTKYSWTMTYELFRDIMFIKPIQEARDRHNDKLHAEAQARGGNFSGIRWLEAPGDDDRFTTTEFIKNYMHNEPQFSDKEMNAGYEQYMDQANLTRQMYENGEVETAWAIMLAQLSEVRQVRLGKWTFESTSLEEEDWRELGCEMHGHDHGGFNTGHRAVECLRLQAPVGGALLDAVLASLFAAGSVVEHLAIECVLDPEFTWIDDGRLDDLDLSHLHTLSFQPMIEEPRPRFSLPGGKRVGETITAILERCATSLRTFDYFTDTSDWLFPFDGSRVVALPALETFRTGATLHQPHFARFLRRARTMKRLELFSCPAHGEWRDIWRSIRYHPRRMVLCFEQMPVNNVAEVSMGHFTGEPSKAENNEGNIWMNIDWSLENYLSGTGRWNKSCKMWFDGWDEGDNDEDSGDETEDEEKEFWRGGNEEWDAGNDDGSDGYESAWSEGSDDEDLSEGVYGRS